MNRPLLLDSEAMSALASGERDRETTVRELMAAALRLGQDVVVPAVVLAELYRGRRRNQMVDACLSRETGIQVRDTDRAFARFVGGVLAGAGAGSKEMVDAHVVAVAAEVGAGVVLTGDPGDMERLAASYPNVVVQSLS